MAVPRKANKQKDKGRCYGCCSRRFSSPHHHGNIYCVQCRTLNACGIHGHTHIVIGDRIRIPRRNASEYVWKKFITTFGKRVRT